MFVRRVSAVAFTLLLLSACGGEGEPGASGLGFTKDNFSQRTTEAMVKKGSAHFEMTIEADEGFITMAGDQLIGEDFDGANASFDYTEFGAADEPSNEMSLRVVDGLIFANLGASSDDKYVRVDPKDSTSELGQAFAPMIDELDLSQSISKFADSNHCREANRCQQDDPRCQDHCVPGHDRRRPRDRIRCPR